MHLYHTKFCSNMSSSCFVEDADWVESAFKALVYVKKQAEILEHEGIPEKDVAKFSSFLMSKNDIDTLYYEHANNNNVTNKLPNPRDYEQVATFLRKHNLVRWTPSGCALASSLYDLLADLTKLVKRIARPRNRSIAYPPWMQQQSRNLPSSQHPHRAQWGHQLQQQQQQQQQQQN